MYTTIEPRLIALLNTDLPSPTYTHPSLDLPPLNDPNILKASGRPLLLEPDAIKRTAKFDRSAGLDPQHHGLVSSSSAEENNGGTTEQRHGKASADRTLGNSSPQSLRKILDDVQDSTASTSKKRAIPETNKDDFVQLPQPVKKHKATKQVVPPIIIGLFEPPPQAALFPPIASSSFHDSHGRNALNTLPLKAVEPKESQRIEPVEEISEPSKAGTAARPSLKKKDVRTRRKWTDDETKNLLLGVHKYGIGNWTDILEDPEFTFNARSGADLKDRFRTCCPAELRDRRAAAAASSGKKVRSTSSLMSENILIDDGDERAEAHAGESSANARKTKSHRKKLEDLAELGIDGPFRKSLRRERRLFTEQEDKWILEGYELHGAAWSKIQRDPRFQLQSRQPTDLRDRFRNKYPDKFRAEKEKEKGKEKGKDNEKEGRKAISRHASFELTMVAMDSEQIKQHLHSPHPPLPSQEHTIKETTDKRITTASILASNQITPTREGLRIEEILSTAHTPSKTGPSSAFHFDADPLPFTQSFDWGTTIVAPFAGPMGEMDISRLLLDESWPEMGGSSGKEKQTLTSILASGVDGGTGETSFYGMLEDGDKEGWGS